ncbi:MAG TPA: hypothetical protein VIL11_00065, partial [Limnochordales bacterium]
MAAAPPALPGGAAGVLLDMQVAGRLQEGLFHTGGPSEEQEPRAMSWMRLAAHGESGGRRLRLRWGAGVWTVYGQAPFLAARGRWQPEAAGLCVPGAATGAGGNGSRDLLPCDRARWYPELWVQLSGSLAAGAALEGWVGWWPLAGPNSPLQEFPGWWAGVVPAGPGAGRDLAFGGGGLPLLGVGARVRPGPDFAYEKWIA